jgi:heme exporter protein D
VVLRGIREDQAEPQEVRSAADEQTLLEYNIRVLDSYKGGIIDIVILWMETYKTRRILVKVCSKEKQEEKYLEIDV